jgi:NAD(P)H-hydrate epimerase
LVLGPGLTTAPERGAELAAILKRARVPMCLDADALNLLSRDRRLWAQTHAPLVVTPHPKEMARLLDTDVAAIQRDRFAAALQLAASRSCVVVLKGAGTVVAEPDGGVAVIGAGNPGMATGGTGDVLAGMIGSLLAQGLDPSNAARLGALAHALAGDAAAARHGQTAMTASSLCDELGTVFRAWHR